MTNTISAETAPDLACVLTARPVEGPFALDERLKRSDLRRDLATGAEADGVPLRLRMTLQRVDGGARTPLAGAVVEVWHCDATGAYGDGVLHGYQVTGADGVAEFATTYPGWYPTRAVHLHFRVRVEDGGAQPREAMSELFFDEASARAVHERSPYSAKGQPDTPNHTDCVYTTLSAGEQAGLTVRATQAADGGYDAHVTLGVRLS
ncbi:MAG TPA: hypothetical protein VF771_05570 [Longimicrobiaceae bacterium]